MICRSAAAAAPGRRGEIQKVRPQPRLSEWESAFKQDPQVVLTGVTSTNNCANCDEDAVTYKVLWFACWYLRALVVRLDVYDSIERGG